MFDGMELNYIAVGAWIIADAALYAIYRLTPSPATDTGDEDEEETPTSSDDRNLAPEEKQRRRAWAETGASAYIRGVCKELFGKEMDSLEDLALLSDKEIRCLYQHMEDRAFLLVARHLPPPLLWRMFEALPATMRVSYKYLLYGTLSGSGLTGEDAEEEMKRLWSAAPAEAQGLQNRHAAYRQHLENFVPWVLIPGALLALFAPIILGVQLSHTLPAGLANHPLAVLSGGLCAAIIIYGLVRYERSYTRRFLRRYRIRCPYCRTLLPDVPQNCPVCRRMLKRPAIMFMGKEVI